MKKEEIEKTLALHKLWLCGKGGERANLSGSYLRSADLSGSYLSDANLSDANLRGADLSGSYLRSADLSDANLSDANLRYADLRGADLSDADLSGADLRGSYLRSADLSDANLRGAYLRGADLSGADLSGSYLSGSYLSDANLRYADLRGADLRGANLDCAYLFNTNLSYIITDENTKLPPISCPEEGSFIAYKKACSKFKKEVIVVLDIPSDAKRSSATSKKCRCSKARVLGFETLLGEEIKEDIFVRSNYDETFLYKKGKIVEVKDFDDNRWEECAAGIHFFMSKQEAIDY